MSFVDLTILVAIIFGILTGAIRAEVLRVERGLITAGRLDVAGDIFHLTLEEVDAALADTTVEMRTVLSPRKTAYLTALRAKACPMLIDSRCRILRPNVVHGEPGTLVGSAISPGLATGLVRVLTEATQPIEPGEVLVTMVTDPSWTLLFAGAAAIVLQIGGVLQHGALCAREYGLPAVSGIDITTLRTGMLVTVDGNTGVVRILDGDEHATSSATADVDDITPIMGSR
jgi:pyruvate,water dikinase